MASAMSVFKKFRSSDGRIKIATLFGGSVLVAVIALLVGVLPVFASHPQAVPLDEGGGSGKCFVETGGLPSAAGNEYHINNPTPGTHTSADGVIQITVYDTDPGVTPEGRLFDFDVISGNNVVYDVIVNGGPKTLHYDYDAHGGPVTDDDGLHAPHQTPNRYHNLSHINVCYDIPGLTSVECDVDAVREEADGPGPLTAVELRIFQNRLFDCTTKSVLLTNSGTEATVEFQGDGTDTIAGRLDFYKDWADASFLVPLQYDGPGQFVDLQWCDVREKDTSPDPVTGLFDGNEFDDVLETDEYPSLVGVTDVTSGGTVDATACKVNEDENADGDQHTVVYFEFVDPNFR